MRDQEEHGAERGHGLQTLALLSRELDPAAWPDKVTTKGPQGSVRAGLGPGRQATRVPSFEPGPPQLWPGGAVGHQVKVGVFNLSEQSADALVLQPVPRGTHAPVHAP